eukprot:bmy_07698T0
MEDKTESLDLIPDAPPDYNCHLNSSDTNPDAPPEYNSCFVLEGQRKATVVLPPRASGPPDQLSLHLHATQEACQLVAPILYSTSLAGILHQSAPTTWSQLLCQTALLVWSGILSWTAYTFFGVLSLLRAGFETNYRYHAKNNLEEIVYIVTEDRCSQLYSECC